MKENSSNWFKRHKVLTGILIFIGLAVLVSAAGGGNKNSNNSDNKSSNNSQDSNGYKTETIATIGQPARDGKFEFTVKGFQCGASSVGDNPYLTKTAQGQFCILSLTIKNIGDKQQSLLSNDQKLLKDKTEYSADDTATLYDSPDGSSWYNDINPGNSVEGKIIFDVPKDIMPTTAELHDSAFSDGVKVNLAQ